MHSKETVLKKIDKNLNLYTKSNTQIFFDFSYFIQKFFYRNIICSKFFNLVKFKEIIKADKMKTKERDLGSSRTLLV